MSFLCDSIPHYNLTIDSSLLRQETQGLIHTTWINGGIFEFKGQWFLCYRTDQRKWCHHPRVHVVMVNRQCTPIGMNYHLNTRSNTLGWRADYRGKCNSGSLFRAEDPRVCVIDDELVIWWTDGFKQYYGTLELEWNEEGLTSAQVCDQYCPKPPYISEIARNLQYDGREKNWTPFDVDGEHWIVYSCSPFICCRIEEGQIVETVQHRVSYDWKYGFIKGGTPAIALDDERYLTIFHSTMKYEGIACYFAGAITFDRTTFRPLQISRYPIVAPLPDGDPDRHNDSYVIFPAGLIVDGDRIYFSYGYNDRLLKVHAMTKADLEYNLRDLIQPFNRVDSSSDDSDTESE